ncbi:uncharacterized protein A4U43_C03F9510 [Asparagus officinalis]|uniref:Large ribosomal subunit protein bL28m n=1 Tax=Asparagus officinalis TaxID=4686 RepID=A0A5P1F8L7_ASPOF|nr:54S ribosomal protein L24, mitochondrial [Asparagus officinalis]ONK74726.1 uncharacterized protein A4U43_C03F9510 [Asparagus officinalis]
MSFRAREMYNKIAKKAGADSMPSQVMESVKKMIPNTKIVMNRAKRGIFAGRHIQFGNKIALQGLNKSRRSWKPNVQEKRLFSYIHDKHICIKVTTHALRWIDKAGGIDEYLLKTPYEKMDTEMGLVWKAKVEKMYAELGNMEVGFFTPEEEDKIAKGFEELKLEKEEARKEARRVQSKILMKELGTRSDQAEQSEEESTDDFKKAEQ